MICNFTTGQYLKALPHLPSQNVQDNIYYNHSWNLILFFFIGGGGREADSKKS